MTRSNPNRRPTCAAAVAAAVAALALGACGGGGGGGGTNPPTAVCSTCAAGTLSGMAAAGAALARAEVRVIDANGRAGTAVAGADGVYRVDVASLQAPFVVQVTANIGGQTVLLHSLATAADVGTAAVNVTPLTDVITATVLGGDPRARVEAGSVDYGAITAARLADAETALEARLAPVLAAAGLSNVDLRSSEFKADHSGLDGVLDALEVSQANGGYTIALVTGAGSISIDPAGPAGSSTLPAPAQADLAARVARLQDMQALLAEFAAKFANGVPAEADLLPYFTDDFRHDGKSRGEFINQVLREQHPAAQGGFSWKGVSFDALRINTLVDADTLDISFRTLFRKGFQSGGESMRVTRVGTAWRMAGNGAIGSAYVSLLSRLKETALTPAQVQALPGVHTFQNGGTTFYQQTVTSTAGQRLDLWLDAPGSDLFGVIAWAGEESGSAARALRRDETRYLAAANSRVSNYIVFTVPTLRVAAAVASVVVTGPGLPAGGLALEPPLRRPRLNWVFKGDAYDWNAFNADRCRQVDNPANPVPNCAIDWSQVHRGSVYTFTFKDGAGAVLGTRSDALRTEPVAEASAHTNRAKLFPLFAVDPAHALSINNLYRDADGPFVPGSPVTLGWAVPPQPGYRIAGISLTVQSVSLDAANQRVVTDYPAYVPLYDADPNAALPTSATLAPAHPLPPIWAWTTLTGVDAFGNVWDHELSPSNPR